LGLFRAAGFTGLDVDKALISLIAFVHGTASAEVALRTSVAASGQSLREWVDEGIALAVEATRDHPELRESIAARAGADPIELYNQTFTFGLESLLDGFAARVGAAEDPETA
jgi:hypothetical protein